MNITKNKLEKSRFVLSITTPLIMILHLTFVSLMVSFLFVGPFYIPIILLYFISTIIPFAKISEFKKAHRCIIATTVLLVAIGSLALLFFAAGGTLGANAVIHSSPVIRLPIGSFYAFVIMSFSIIATLILSLTIFSLLAIFIKNNLTQGEQQK